MNDLYEILTSQISDVDALRNVANSVIRHTEITRHYNGRGKSPTRAGDKEQIAQSARHLAELVLQALEQPNIASSLTRRGVSENQEGE